MREAVRYHVWALVTMSSLRSSVLGARSLRRAVNEYMEHYHHERNHQGLNNLIPMPYVGQNQDEKGSIVKSERFGELLNYYYRKSETEDGKEQDREA